MSDTLSPQILFLEQQLHDAQRLNDVAALNRLLHEDLLFVGPMGTLVSKDDDLEAHRNQLLQLLRQEPGATSICFQGPQTAIATVSVFLSGSYAGQPIDGYYQYLRVWQRQYEGNWQIIAGSCVAIAEN